MRGSATRRLYIVYGVALGIFPTVVYSAACTLTSHAGPPIALAFAGVAAGLLAGIVLYRESRARQYG